MVGAQPTGNEDLNETLRKPWEINKLRDECNDPEVTDAQKHFQDTILNLTKFPADIMLPWMDNKQNLHNKFQISWREKRLTTCNMP